MNLGTISSRGSMLMAPVANSSTGGCTSRKLCWPQSLSVFFPGMLHDNGASGAMRQLSWQVSKAVG